VMARSHLKSVSEATPQTPRDQWLAITSEITRTEKRLYMMRAARSQLKPAIMDELGVWCMSDALVTAELMK
jgi:hypothetical protein